MCVGVPESPRYAMGAVRETSCVTAQTFVLLPPNQTDGHQGIIWKLLCSYRKGRSGTEISIRGLVTVRGK